MIEFHKQQKYIYTIFIKKKLTTDSYINIKNEYLLLLINMDHYWYTVNNYKSKFTCTWAATLLPHTLKSYKSVSKVQLKGMIERESRRLPKEPARGGGTSRR